LIDSNSKSLGEPKFIKRMPFMEAIID